ncbi:MAG: glutathione ABC transporter substrate-binding protein [Desulfurococcales archaeon]|nr:glutathione ABC transporter substrate-binding protein [Desulfurococcales archaeon]
MNRGLSKTAAVLVIIVIVLGIIGAYYAFKPQQPAGGASETAATTTTAPEMTQTTAAGKPAKDTLVVAMGTDIVTLDLHDASDNPSYMVGRMIYEYLVELDENMNIKPGLATSWEVKDNGTVWVFHLRKGVKFQDGTPFNATAVKVNFDRLLTQKLKRSSLFTPFIKEVKVVDDYTVEFILKRPFGAFLYHLAHGAAAIMSPKSILSGDPAKHPVGTGPYMLEEWVPGDRIVLKAFDGYWNKDKAPKFKKVIFKIVPDDQTRMRLLQSGDVDIALRIPPQYVKELNATEGITVLVKPTNRVIFIGMNNLVPPLNDKRVRQALNYAVDKDAIIKNVLFGLGEPATSPIAPLTHGYCKAGEYKYDPDKAKQLLAQAGWTDRDNDGVLENSQGEELHLTLWTPRGRYVGDYEMAQAVQQYLQAIGIKVDLQVWEWASYVKELFKGPNETKRELFLIGWAPSTGDADWGLRPLFYSKMWAPKGANMWFYKNDAVDELIEKQMTLLGDQRLQALCQVQKLIWDDAPTIFMVVMYDSLGMKDNVKGVVYLPTEIVVLKYAYWEG